MSTSALIRNRLNPIQKQAISTYVSLRIGVALIGFLFPLILSIGGKLYAHISLADSMSAYYHATADFNEPCVNGQPAPTEGLGPMRNWFVGLLFAVGSFMFLNKGFSHAENHALNIAGVMATCVALFPMKWSYCGPVDVFSLHGAFASIFFVCLAFVCAFCSGKTLKEMPPEPNRTRIIATYRIIYRILAAAMLLSPVSAFAINKAWGHTHYTFWVELCGIWAFSAFWFVKTLELSYSGVELRILAGDLVLDPKSIR